MDTRKNIILILASVGTFVEALDIAIINLTIPSIQEQFNIDAGTVQWLQTLYVLFFGGFLIIGGKLSDQIGRKKMFLLGAFIFMLTSLGAGLSSSFEMLALFRALQGLGAALVMPSALSIVTNTFREEQERNRAIGVFSSFAAIGSGSGLSVGGIISTYLSWHWVFLINVPILLITLILSYYYLPTDEKNETAKKTDIISGILMVVGLLSLTYGTHELVHIKEQPFLVIGSLVAAVLLLVMVFYRLKSVAEPLFDLKLFKHGSLVVSNAVFFTLGAFFIGFLFLISLMLQKDMGYSAASAGLMLVPFSIISALTAKFILPHVSKRLNSTQMGIFGWSFMLMGGLLLLISVYTGHPLTVVLLGSACISGVGMTFCFTALSVMGIQDVEPSSYGLASSLSSTSYFLGAGIGLSFMTLMSQIFLSEFSVGSLNLIILIGYALVALGMLFYFIVKSLKVKQTEIAVS
ncbi:MFS transporter [Chryseobacterium joostei]|uniref:Drug resistance transporter, EmrB/QacA subfamily n=1 Tax=Chryseobacterium joostei TaxID=112234 RepID=A0A1N7I1H0_9FLAO|nr:MFS transporter [Chryseobacterium joostei]AZA99455.1 MFS transporter [Chryseobacterium joostei]SIS30930.1 drug resistance transporter, EmrB/QacA subfamily [Chryseobacterium joostei]SIS47255.1 drug resistance transporter, EmrB/QacA subfamily [Chryseobacterium joostei]